MIVGMGSLIGKVAADHSHKWIFNEPQDHDVNYLSAWPIPGDSVSWLALHFSHGFGSQDSLLVLTFWGLPAPEDMGSSVSVWHQGPIQISHSNHTISFFYSMVRTDHFGKFTQTIALIAVGEGVVQLGSVNKVLSLSPSPPPPL